MFSCLSHASLVFSSPNPDWVGAWGAQGSPQGVREKRAGAPSYPPVQCRLVSGAPVPLEVMSRAGRLPWYWGCRGRCSTSTSLSPGALGVGPAETGPKCSALMPLSSHQQRPGTARPEAPCPGPVPLLLTKGCCEQSQEQGKCDREATGCLCPECGNYGSGMRAGGPTGLPTPGPGTWAAAIHAHCLRGQRVGAAGHASGAGKAMVAAPQRRGVPVCRGLPPAAGRDNAWAWPGGAVSLVV